MVQINLPKNSKVTKGKYYQDKTGFKKYKEKLTFIDGTPSTGEKILG